MAPSRALATLPVLIAAAAFGTLAGIGGYAFVYAKGSSYLGNDPATCANCHVMEGHYSGWQQASHHGVATCNDCHTPSGLVGKYWTKAVNGWHHSFAFTTGDFPDVIRARPESQRVVEGQCRHCHAAIVDTMASGPHGGQVSCVKCHASVGHLR